jgi:hypothetical protein
VIFTTMCASLLACQTVSLNVIHVKQGAMTKKPKIQEAVDETRSVALSLRVRPTVKRALDEAAKGDRRTTSSLCEIVLEHWLKEKGWLK